MTLAATGFEVLGTTRFLRVPKTLPAPLLGAGCLPECARESPPFPRRIGVTTLVRAAPRWT